MTGTLLDVCLALLLIGAAAVTLVDADANEPTVSGLDGAEATADTLATTTAAVNYTVARDGGGGPDSSTASPEAERVAHATLAGHLARAAVRSATVDGTRLSPASADYRRAVRAAVAATVGANVRVRATWTPLPGRGLSGEIRVGPSPPPAADVAAARFTVPVAAQVGRSKGGTATGASVTDGTDATEATDAHAAVAVLFPPDRIAATARDDGPAAALVRERYRRAGDALGVDALGAFERESPRAANRLLAGALAEREGGANTTPPGNTRSGDPGTVTVVVRTWSP